MPLPVQCLETYIDSRLGWEYRWIDGRLAQNARELLQGKTVFISASPELMKIVPQYKEAGYKIQYVGTQDKVLRIGFSLV